MTEETGARIRWEAGRAYLSVPDSVINRSETLKTQAELARETDVQLLIDQVNAGLFIRWAGFCSSQPAAHAALIETWQAANYLQDTATCRDIERHLARTFSTVHDWENPRITALLQHISAAPVSLLEAVFTASRRPLHAVLATTPPALHAAAIAAHITHDELRVPAQLTRNSVQLVLPVLLENHPGLLSLDLASNDLGTDSMTQVLHGLHALPHLTALNLSGNSFPLRGFEHIGPHCAALVDLRLAQCSLDDGSAHSLLRCLALLPSLRHLVLAKNRFNFETAPKLAVAIGALSALHSLDISDNVTGKGAGALAGHLARLTQLTCLRMRSLGMSVQFADDMVGMLQALSGSLRVLDLWCMDCGADTDGREELIRSSFAVIARMTDLVELCMCDNMRPFMMQHPLVSLTTLAGLETLAVSHSVFDAAAFSPHAHAWPQLRCLKLRNVLGSQSLTALVPALRAFSLLQDLDLSSSGLASTSMHTLASHASALASLQSLNLGYNPNIKTNGLNFFAQSFIHLTNLRFLGLYCVATFNGAPDISPFARGVAVLTLLTRLDFSKNLNGDDAARQLALHLGSLGELEELEVLTDRATVLANRTNIEMARGLQGLTKLRKLMISGDPQDVTAQFIEEAILPDLWIDWRPR